MCTCMIAGRKASATGNAILAANDDWEGVPGVLTHTPRAAHAEGETYTLTGGADIPQVDETCGYVYTACGYGIGTLDRSWAGGMNDRGVAVAGTGVDAYRPVAWKEEGYLLEPDDIPLLVLQRGKTARQAVRCIGDLIQAYGLRPSYFEGGVGSSAATFSIADREEGWVLEVYPGRCWLAVRVPDDCVSVRVNAFGTHDADLTDPENTMCSPGLAEYARERGLWNGDPRHFDFAAAFGSETSPTEWGPEKDPMNLRRRWRAMYLVDGIEEPEETLRYLARPAGKTVGAAEASGKAGNAPGETVPGMPAEKSGGAALDRKQGCECSHEKDRIGHAISQEDLMKILSDVYEGTPYDLTKVPEGGPGHDPLADNMPDYALCRVCTVASIVTDYAGKEKEPLLWTAMGTPRLVPYIPIWTDTDGIPKCCGMPERLEVPDQRYDTVHAGNILYEEWKQLCLLVRRNYEQNECIAAEAKAEYQKEMRALIGEEISAEKAEREQHTRQNEAHIRKALETCRAVRERLTEQEG